MDKNFKEYLTQLEHFKTTSTPLTNEQLAAGVMVNINRIMIELQDIKDSIINSTLDIYSIFLLGAQIELIKRNIITINQEYLKK